MTEPSLLVLNKSADAAADSEHPPIGDSLGDE